MCTMHDIKSLFPVSYFLYPTFKGALMLSKDVSTVLRRLLCEVNIASKGLTSFS